MAFRALSPIAKCDWDHGFIVASQAVYAGGTRGAARQSGTEARYSLREMERDAAMMAVVEFAPEKRDQRRRTHAQSN